VAVAEPGRASCGRFSRRGSEIVATTPRGELASRPQRRAPAIERGEPRAMLASPDAGARGGGEAAAVVGHAQGERVAGALGLHRGSSRFGERADAMLDAFSTSVRESWAARAPGAAPPRIDRGREPLAHADLLHAEVGRMTRSISSASVVSCSRILGSAARR